VTQKHRHTQTSRWLTSLTEKESETAQRSIRVKWGNRIHTSKNGEEIYSKESNEECLRRQLNIISSEKQDMAGKDRNLTEENNLIPLGRRKEES